jgi:hypothetical protein
VGKGPTNLTGFYNGVTVGAFSYVIILHRGDNVPSFYQIQNDAELIERTNQIDTSVVRTTKEECFSYFAGQSDKMIVNKDYDAIITDGLVLLYDSNFLPSYPSTSSTWYNLGPLQQNALLENGPIFNSNGWIEFDGTNDFIKITSTSSISFQPNQNFSLFCIFNVKSINGTTSVSDNTGVIFGQGITSGSFGIGANYNQITNSYNFRIGVRTTSNTIISSDTNSLVLNVIYNVGFSYSPTSIKVYIDGVLKNTISTTSISSSAFSSSDYHIYRNYPVPGGNGRWLNGNVYGCSIYNKSLSDQEVLQNYYLCNIQTTNLSFLVDPRNIVSNETSTTITDLTSNKFIFNYEETVEKSGSFGGTLRLNSGRLYRNAVSWYGNYTFGFWFKNQGSIQSALFYTESNRGPSGCARVYSIMQSNGTFRYRVWDNSSTTPLGGGQRQVDTITNVQDGNWHFVTCVWSNGNSNRGRGLYVFVNGVLEATTDIIGNDGSYASLHIGGASGCIGTAAWNCYLGPFMQYSNLAMNDIQVMNLYESYRSRYR